MLKFLRKLFAYQLSRKMESVGDFIRVVGSVGLGPTVVNVAAKLEAGDLVDFTTGKVLFAAGNVTREEVLFQHTGLPTEGDLALLYQKSDQQIRSLQGQLPDVLIMFSVIFLPNGESLMLTKEIKMGLQRLGVKTGVT